MDKVGLACIRLGRSMERLHGTVILRGSMGWAQSRRGAALNMAKPGHKRRENKPVAIMSQAKNLGVHRVRGHGWQLSL